MTDRLLDMEWEEHLRGEQMIKEMGRVSIEEKRLVGVESEEI